MRVPCSQKISIYCSVTCLFPLYIGMINWKEYIMNPIVYIVP